MKFKFKDVMQSVKAKAVPVVSGVAGTTALAAISCFAEEPGATSNLPSFVITQDMLKPVVDGLMSNIGVILPVGLGLFTIMLGVRLIPGLFSSFLRLR